MKNIFDKMLAFTLAETLVVMGIIGVVAALTIPNLNQSTGDREKVAKVKKIYANLEDAFGRATAVYGPVDEWFVNSPSQADAEDRLADRITEFMKISKNCGRLETGCFPDVEYKKLDGTVTSNLNDLHQPMVLLADGTALFFTIESQSCSRDMSKSGTGPSSEVCAIIVADIDGVKGSNTWGKDFFVFWATKQGVVPGGGQDTKIGDVINEACFTEGEFCASWIVETGNMDYLKATKGTCPNGTDLWWDNTTCK